MTNESTAAPDAHPSERRSAHQVSADIETVMAEEYKRLQETEFIEYHRVHNDLRRYAQRVRDEFPEFFAYSDAKGV